ncbi:LysR family transcriptional regulator [Roseobacteraceae bacterium S113]
MAQINIKQLQAFVAVADYGTFRRAADQLHTTQPNISARIAALESQLCLRLMARDAGSVRLTPKGMALLPKAREVLRALDGVLEAAQDNTLFDGVLRLGVTEMIVHSWLGAYLSMLKERFANIDVDLTVDLSARLSRGLAERSLDLALQNAPFPRALSGCLDLGRYGFTWVAAPSLNIPNRALALEELATQPILTHARGTLPHDQLQDHLAAAPKTKTRLVASTNMSACIQMTLEGLGVACLPTAMVRTELAAGALVALEYGWRPEHLHFHARYDAETAPHYVREAAQLAFELSGQVHREMTPQG